MAKITDLPNELLQRIIQPLDALYELETSLDIFNIMRVNRQFRDVAIDVHFNIIRPSNQPTNEPYGSRIGQTWTEEEWSGMIVKMVRHERCYLNYQKAKIEREKKRRTIYEQQRQDMNEIMENFEVDAEYGSQSSDGEGASASDSSGTIHGV